MGVVIDRSGFALNLYIKMVHAMSIESAMRKAPFNVIGSATSSYRRAGSPESEHGLFLFCKSYVERKRCEQGEGFIVTIKNPKKIGKLNIRLNPKGKFNHPMTKLRSCYVVYDSHGDEVCEMEDITGPKEAATKVERMVNSGEISLEDGLVCKFEYRFAKGVPNTVFEIEKTNTGVRGLGRYLIFGIQSIL